MKKAIGIVEGSFLADVFGFIDKGDFPAIDNAIKEDEEVIGEMSAFEKGLRAYTVSASKKEAEIVDFLNDEMRKADQESSEFRTKLGELKAVREGFELADKLMWNSINGRLNTWGCIVGICTDYKIVKPVSSEDDGDNCDCPVCQLRRSLMGGISGMSIVRVGMRR